MADPASGSPPAKPAPLQLASNTVALSGQRTDMASPGAPLATPLTPLPQPATVPRACVAVGLFEAARDSPSFRASAVLFGEQVDGIERWLESYVKGTSKLVHDFEGLQDTICQMLSRITPPPGAADGVLDADHTVLALKRVSDGTREWWLQTSHALRRFDVVNAEPLRNFLNGELRAFKETRRALEHAQKTYDATLARYVGQSKAKEPSALREDAFQLFETRRAYLKAAMDFAQMAPQLRSSLDKLLIRVSADLCSDMNRARRTYLNSPKWGDDMDRIRGWAKELELSEAALRREQHVIRREVSATTIAAVKPSREIDDYSASTVPFLGSRGPVDRAARDPKAAVISEKQGWLFLRTVTGKPARVSWVPRWFYCRDGIFGYLVQGPQGVLQGDDIGVLLCSAKPAVQEERRFCMEVKTKSRNLLLQAETQQQLTEWLEVFDVAKKQAFEASMARDNATALVEQGGGIDPAFAITPPLVADFSARALDAAALGTVDESGPAHNSQSSTLPLPGGGPEASFAGRSSFDVSNSGPPRRSITILGQELRREEGESGREHAARIMQKLDIHRKPTWAQQQQQQQQESGAGGLGSGSGGSGGNGGNGVGGGGSAGGMPPPAPSSGIASLLSASHNLLPGHNAQRAAPATMALPLLEPQRGGLTPTTFTKSPLLTFLSKVAVTASSERILSRPGLSCGLPPGILANYWGTALWGSDQLPRIGGESGHGVAAHAAPAMSTAVAAGHRKTLSVDTARLPEVQVQGRAVSESFPAGYPTDLRVQHAQFRLLFPTVPLTEKLVLVFNAAWSSASEAGATNQGLVGNGRVYATADNLYFYSQTMGLVVTYVVPLDIITEVTAAPGKDCDFTFLHLGEDANATGFTRITIKTFLDDMDLLHARLNLLVDDLQSAEPMDVAELVAALQELACDEPGHRSPTDAESWDEGDDDDETDGGRLSRRLGSGGPSPGGGGLGGGGRRSAMQRTRPASRGGHPHLHQHQRQNQHLTRGGSRLQQLPTAPVVYEPDDMQRKVAERHFEIGAKACFHVLFGDQSFVFARQYQARRARAIEQGPWRTGEGGQLVRQFRFEAESADLLGRRKTEQVVDEQVVDVVRDHAAYVVRVVKTAWHLPHAHAFKQVTKVVITHVAKSKCKLAVWVRIDWTRMAAAPLSWRLVQRQALDDAARDGDELAERATDAVRQLGAHSRTKRAIEVYGPLGQQTQAVVFAGADGEGASDDAAAMKPRTLTAMLAETVRSLMESAVTSLVIWAFFGCRKLFQVVTAHRVLLAVLALSVATNAVLTSRETAAWWTERHAVQFMGRLGVGPNLRMSRALYLADLEAVVAVRGEPADDDDDDDDDDDSLCHAAFRAVANATDLDAPAAQAGAGLATASSRATAARLRRARQRLGAFRHDLAVAMRVVNSVEREVVQSEWTNWLADETWRCAQAGRLLERGVTVGGAADGPGPGSDADAGPGSDPGPGDNKTRQAQLRQWHEAYCGSCLAEQRALDAQEGRDALV